MRWIRSNAGWLAAVATLVAGGSTAYVSLYVRAALADTTSRVSALEAHRADDVAWLQRIDEKVGDVHRWLMEDRRDKGER